MDESSTENPAPVYAVYYPEDIVSSPRNLYSSLREAAKFANSPEGRGNGARFKRFGTPNEAREFLSGAGDCGRRSESTALPAADPVVPFSSVSKMQMNQLKRVVESDAVAEFVSLATANPRFLINVSGDSAAIVVEGFRYNALHVAARSGSSAVAERLLQMITDIDYLARLYGTSREDAAFRQENIVHSYLNTPDKGNGDTPLHLAAKFGHYGVARALVSYPQCKKMLRNKADEMARDVVCSRGGGEGETRSALQLLLNSHFVALYRATDHCSPPRLLVCPDFPSESLAAFPSSSLHSPSLPSPSFSSPSLPSSPALLSAQHLAAVVGPFHAKSSAEQFLHKWRNCDRNVQRRDAEKGMERVGRALAKEDGLTWAETWPFSHSPIDISAPHGLQCLETHLMGMRRKQMEEEGEEEEFIDAEEEMRGGHDSLLGLEDLMAALAVTDNSFQEEEESKVDDDVKEEFLTAPSSPAPLFACLDFPTRMDTQLLEVLSTLPASRLCEYPLIRLFMSSLHRLSPSRLSDCPPLSSPRTHRKLLLSPLSTISRPFFSLDLSLSSTSL